MSRQIQRLQIGSKAQIGLKAISLNKLNSKGLYFTWQWLISTLLLTRKGGKRPEGKWKVLKFFSPQTDKQN